MEICCIFQKWRYVALPNTKAKLFYIDNMQIENITTLF